MKQVVAIVKPFLAEKVLESLRRAPLEACSVREVKGTAGRRAISTNTANSEYSLAFLPKVEITLWVDDARAEEVDPQDRRSRPHRPHGRRQDLRAVGPVVRSDSRANLIAPCIARRRRLASLFRRGSGEDPLEPLAHSRDDRVRPGSRASPRRRSPRETPASPVPAARRETLPAGGVHQADPRFDAALKPIARREKRRVVVAEAAGGGERLRAPRSFPAVESFAASAHV